MSQHAGRLPCHAEAVVTSQQPYDMHSLGAASERRPRHALKTPSTNSATAVCRQHAITQDVCSGVASCLHLRLAGSSRHMTRDDAPSAIPQLTSQKYIPTAVQALCTMASWLIMRLRQSWRPAQMPCPCPQPAPNPTGLRSMREPTRAPPRGAPSPATAPQRPAPPCSIAAG